MIPDLPDSMAETTEDCSSAEDTLAVSSNLDADLRSLAPCSPAVPTDPEVIFISPATSPLTHPPNQGWNDEPVSPDSTSTLEASDNDASVEASSSASLQFFADDGNEDQHKPPPAYSFPNDGRPILSHPNQFKHRTETSNLANSRQHHKEQFASKPTAIIRPRINYRLRYGLNPEIDSWEIIFWDNQPKELTIQNTSLTSQRD